MAQKPVLRGEVGCACGAREVSVERGGMGESPPNAPESLASAFLLIGPASGTLAVAHLAHYTHSATRLDEGALASRSPEQDPRGGAPRRTSAVPQDEI